MRNFRKLEADEIECRIAEIPKSGKGLFLLLYKTARTDAALLDETVGWMNWQCDFKEIDGKMYCGIGIKRPTDEEWVWKWDCGTESNMEAEKGQASDAFKRAGFKWGLGAELYTSPRIWIPAERCNITGTDRLKCYDRFRVTEIGYDADGKITRLKIGNEATRKTCYDWTA